MMGKTLYHSELARMGNVEAQITSDVMKSQYKGKPPYVILKMDDGERLYNVENRECERALAGLKGKRVILAAFGSREEAGIEVEILGSTIGTSNPERTIIKNEAGEIREQRPETLEERQAREARAFMEASAFAGRARVLFEICYVHARLSYKPEDFPNLSEAELENLRLRMTQSIAARVSSVTDLEQLPVKWPEPPPQPEPPQESSRVEEEAP